MTSRPRSASGWARSAAAGAGVCAVVVAGCSGSSGGSSATAGAAATGVPVSSGATALQQSFVDVIHHTLPSVVAIRTDSGLGSGVVFDDDGHIVTNAHVVGDATSFQVTPANSTSRLSATLVGAYAPDDLAVIKVTGGSELHPAAFADSSRVRVGDVVLAMGNPLGLASSVTEGIVSATGRTVGEPASGGSGGATLPDSIQTSAAINPGNSGGALVTLDGKVVGIPTLAALSSAGNSQSAAPGIGFAIPSNTAKDIAGQLVEHGRVVDSHRAAIGASVVTVAGPTGEAAGVGIDQVTANGPAASAGLEAGDVITAVDGRATPDTEALAAVLATLRPGQRVPVMVTKQNGHSETVNVTLGELPGG